MNSGRGHLATRLAVHAIAPAACPVCVTGCGAFSNRRSRIDSLVRFDDNWGVLSLASKINDHAQDQLVTDRARVCISRCFPSWNAHPDHAQGLRQALQGP